MYIYIYKNGADFLPVPISYLVNLYFTTEELSKLFKVAKVITKVTILVFLIKYLYRKFAKLNAFEISSLQLLYSF